MKVVNKINLKLDGFDKCCFVCDSDCPIGQIHDYACALRAFVLEKMNEASATQQQSPPSEEEKKD